MNPFLLVTPNCKSGSRINYVRFIPNESLGHIILKTKVCYEIIKAGGNFLCEAVFKRTGKRADIISDIGGGTIYEILHSEKIEDCLSKINQYPRSIKIVAVWEEDGIVKTKTIREAKPIEKREWEY